MICFYSNKTYIVPEILDFVKSYPINYCVKNYIDDYLLTSAEYHIAIVNVVNDYEPWGYDYYHMDHGLLHKIITHSDLVFICDPELHQYHWELFKEFDSPKVYWVIPGTLTNDLIPAKYVQHGHMFSNMLCYYRENKPNSFYQRLARLLPPTHIRPLYFDALLGSKRPHRDFIFDYINDQKLSDQMLVSYQQDQSFKKFVKDGFVLDNDVSVPEIADGYYVGGTYMRVSVDELTIPLCNLIPVDAYNKCAYSIVAETEFENTHIMLTEKVIKPIIAKRLFVVFSGQGYLEAMHRLGFQTFGNIIDESYDREPDNWKRWAMAAEQIAALCHRDQTIVLKQASSIVEHNYRHFMDTNWATLHLSSVCKLIYSIAFQQDIRT